MGNACSEQISQKQTLEKSLKTQASSPFFKVVIFGDEAAGKTSVCLRFAFNKFSDKHYVNDENGIFLPYKVKLNNGNTIKLNLWDTLQEKWKKMLHLIAKHAKGIIVLYDIGSKRSFETAVRYWVGELKEQVEEENIVMYLVGNKKDLSDDKRQVPSSMAAKIAEEKGVLFMEVSAKTGENVKELFMDMAEEMVRRSKLEKSYSM